MYVLQVNGEEHQHKHDEEEDSESGQHTVEDLMSQLNALWISKAVHPVLWSSIHPVKSISCCLLRQIIVCACIHLVKATMWGVYKVIAMTINVLAQTATNGLIVWQPEVGSQNVWRGYSQVIGCEFSQHSNGISLSSLFNTECDWKLCNMH